jgi:hypothetical protein
MDGDVCVRPAALRIGSIAMARVKYRGGTAQSTLPDVQSLFVIGIISFIDLRVRLMGLSHKRGEEQTAWETLRWRGRSDRLLMDILTSFRFGAIFERRNRDENIAIHLLEADAVLLSFSAAVSSPPPTEK